MSFHEGAWSDIDMLLSLVVSAQGKHDSAGKEKARWSSGRSRLRRTLRSAESWRRGVVRPPSLEELQVPEHHAALAENGAYDNSQNATADREDEVTSGYERVKDESTITSTR